MRWNGPPEGDESSDEIARGTVRVERVRESVHDREIVLRDHDWCGAGEGIHVRSNERWKSTRWERGEAHRTKQSSNPAKKRRHRQARHQRRNWSPSKSRERPLVNLLCSHHTVPSGAEMPYPIGIGGQEKGLGLRVDIRNVHLNRRARRIRWRQLTASHGTTDATACGEACIAEVLKKVGLLQSK